MDELPHRPGILGLWADAATARTLRIDTGGQAGCITFLASAASLWEPVSDHLDIYAETVTSSVRTWLAPTLASDLELKLRAPEDRRGPWDLDEDSDMRLSYWLAMKVEVGWWMPPSSMRDPVEDVRREVMAATRLRVHPA
jgi:hypothetical protein